MRKFFHSIISQILPSLYAHKANKKLRKKISSDDSQSSVPQMDNVDVISIDCFRQKYAETFDIKDKFEDKAKTNVIGITISITIIMGASGLTNSIINKYPYPIFHWISFIILLVAIIYLLVSGIDAIKVLFGENMMSTVDLHDLATDDINTKEKYDNCTNRNIQQNTIRNNIVYSSYICIRNALICLMVLFIFVSIPFSYEKTSSDIYDTIMPSKASISYSSKITIPERLNILYINDSIIRDRASRVLNSDGTIYSFVNVTDKYYIQYKCFGSEIIVEEFFSFDRVLDEP